MSAYDDVHIELTLINNLRRHVTYGCAFEINMYRDLLFTLSEQRTRLEFIFHPNTLIENDRYICRYF